RSTYASLTAAQACGLPRAEVLLERGQVLAEWGVSDLALHELDEALAGVEAPPMVTPNARMMRGFALACLGDYKRALADFWDAVWFTDSTTKAYFQGIAAARCGEMNAARYYLAQLRDPDELA